MPRILLRDPFCLAYQIDSANRDTIQAWFDEILPLAYPGDDPRLGYPTVDVQPFFVLDQPDWPCDTRFAGQWITIPRDPALAWEALDRAREDIERKIREKREKAGR
jgi:hypothetical protein